MSNLFQCKIRIRPKLRHARYILSLIKLIPFVNIAHSSFLCFAEFVAQMVELINYWFGWKSWSTHLPEQPFLTSHFTGWPMQLSSWEGRIHVQDRPTQHKRNKHKKLDFSDVEHIKLPFQFVQDIFCRAARFMGSLPKWHNQIFHI